MFLGKVRYSLFFRSGSFAHTVSGRNIGGRERHISAGNGSAVSCTRVHLIGAVSSAFVGPTSAVSCTRVHLMGAVLGAFVGSTSAVSLAYEDTVDAIFHWNENTVFDVSGGSFVYEQLARRCSGAVKPV